MQIKLIFTTKVSHLASFWKWDFLELGNVLFEHSNKTVNSHSYLISYSFIHFLIHLLRNMLNQSGEGKDTHTTFSHFSNLMRLVCFQKTMTFTSFSRHHMFAVLNFWFVLNRENLVYKIANEFFDVFKKVAKATKAITVS